MADGSPLPFPSPSVILSEDTSPVNPPQPAEQPARRSKHARSLSKKDGVKKAVPKKTAAAAAAAEVDAGPDAVKGAKVDKPKQTKSRNGNCDRTCTLTSRLHTAIFSLSLCLSVLLPPLFLSSYHIYDDASAFLRCAHTFTIRTCNSTKILIKDCARLLYVQSEAAQMWRREAGVYELFEEGRRVRRLQESVPVARLWRPSDKVQHHQSKAGYVHIGKGLHGSTVYNSGISICPDLHIHSHVSRLTNARSLGSVITIDNTYGGTT